MIMEILNWNLHVCNTLRHNYFYITCFVSFLPRRLSGLNGLEGERFDWTCGLPRSSYSPPTQVGIGSVNGLGRPPRGCRTSQSYIVLLCQLKCTQVHVEVRARMRVDIHHPPPLFLRCLLEVQIIIRMVLPLTLLNPRKCRPPSRRTKHVGPLHHFRAWL